MMTRSTRAFLVAACVALPAACSLGDNGPSIPDNAIVYVFSNRTLSSFVYAYTDTASGIKLHQQVIDSLGYAGALCLGLSPHAAVTDTFGTFVFAYNGPNVAEVYESLNGTVDTLVKVFQIPGMGTHGSYTLDTTSGKLALKWTDGVPSQYFDPSSDLRLLRDTLKIHAELSAFADSIHATWRMTWPHDVCQP
jgi:hypothetical protein